MFRLSHSQTNGFTLIELLVVISIIALLASIVLTSLTSAKNTAYDNSVRAGMKQLAAQVEIAAGPSGYGAGLTLPWGWTTAISTNPAFYCNDAGIFANSGLQQILKNIAQNAKSNGAIACTVDSTGSKWAISVSQLRGGGAWCIDNSSDIDTNTASGGSC